MNNVNKKVIIIGLDGATWNILKPWAETDKLPHIKRMMEEGIWGKLESTFPPVTGPAWVSFATGKNPGKHGCYDFALPQGSLTELKPITTRDIKAKTFYETLTQNGKDCIMVNLPASYPPRIKEIVITSLLTQGDNFVFPPDLVSEIPEFQDYRIISDKRLQLYGKNTAYIEDVTKLEKTRFECARQLFTKKDWDLFFILFSGTDWLQHKMYGELSSGNLTDNSLAMEFYKMIDEYIGWFTTNAPPNSNILVMSDHGFKLYHKLFSINDWLKQEGYLATEPKTRPTVPRHRGARETIKLKSNKKVLKLPLFLSPYQRLLRKLAPLYKVVQMLLPLHLTSSTLQPKISQTIAYGTSPATNVCTIYINDSQRFTDGIVGPDNYENIRDDIIDKLRKLLDTKTGKPIVSKIWKGEELYQGKEIKMAPDIVFMTDEYVVGRSFEHAVLSACKRSNHELNGIFIAHGPDIIANKEIHDAKIYDIAPTIFHIFGLPVPNDMDGRVLTQIFKKDSTPAQRQVIYHDVDLEQDRIKNRIDKLKKSGKL